MDQVLQRDVVRRLRERICITFKEMETAFSFFALRFYQSISTILIISFILMANMKFALDDEKIKAATSGVEYIMRMKIEVARVLYVLNP